MNPLRLSDARVEVGTYSVFPPQGQSWSPSSSLPGNLVNSFNEPNKCAPWSRGSITPSFLCARQVCRAPGRPPWHELFLPSALSPTCALAEPRLIQ